MSYQKRLLKEKEENKNGFEYFYIQPLQNDLFKWHFTVKGVEGSIYEGGLYHGYFDIPHDYPLSPPNIYFLNENGRYETNKKICMNITSYHKEEWSPAWTLRTMMQAVNAHFVVEDKGIGSIQKSDQERKELAKNSRSFKCSVCGPIEPIASKYLK
jgi:ubiquitin-conjugating enzyme E2 J1